MKMTKRTKQCKNLRNFFTFLHILALIVPLAYFTIYLFATGQPVQKVSLSVAVVTVAILAVLSTFIAVKHKAKLHTSMFWLMVLVIGLCLQSAKVFILVMAIVSIVDELLFQTMREKYSELTRTNKEIDRRE